MQINESKLVLTRIVNDTLKLNTLKANDEAFVNLNFMKLLQPFLYSIHKKKSENTTAAGFEPARASPLHFECNSLTTRTNCLFSQGYCEI